MHKYSRYLLLFGVIFLAAWLLLLLGLGPSSRNRLDAYVSQLKAQGEKLTLPQLMEFRSTNHDNGQALIQLTNAVAQIGKNARERFVPGTLELRKFVSPAHARVLWREEHPWEVSSRTAKNTWKDFADEMERLKEPLSEIRNSLTDPPADGGPPNGLWGNRGVNFVAERSAAQWLSGATLCELHQGHLEAALQNLEALAAVARVNRDEYTLVAQMIRVAVTGLGLAASWEALQASGWSDAQLQRLQSAWESIDLLTAAEKGLLGERAGGMEIWAIFRTSNGPKKIWTLFGGRPTASLSLKTSLEEFADLHVFAPIYKITSVNEDELFFLKTMQETIDAVRATERGGSWSQVRGQVNKTLNQVLKTSSSLGRLRYTLTLTALPNLFKAGDTAAKTETERRLTITAIALKRFELKYKTLPETLAALVPEFLAAVPKDPMSGMPLYYRLEPPHQFRLYSAGLDGQDDGGDATPAANRYGLWEGPDAVWPEAVPEP